MNQIGVCAAVYGDRALDEALDALAELEFDLVDLPTDSTLRLLRPWWDGSASAADIRRAVVGRGFRVACVSNSRDSLLLLGPYGPHTDPVLTGTRQQKRAHARAAAKRTIDLAVELEAPLVRLFLGCPDFARWLTWQGSHVRWRDNIVEAVDAMAGLVDQARTAGLTLCIEPHPKQVVFDYASTLEFFEVLADQIDVVSLCVDPANLTAVGCRPGSYIAAFARQVACVHVKDVELWAGGRPPQGPGWVRYGPQPPIRFRALGWGAMNWRAIVTAFTETGYEGPFLIEHEDVLVNREEGLRSARRDLRDMLAASGWSERSW